jgi:two-component system sensor histidine kinase BaeS
MRLFHQIALALTATVLGVVALVAVSGDVSIERAFTDYLERVERERLEAAVPRLEKLWALDGDFSRVVDDPRLFGRLLTQDEDLGERRPRRRGGPANHPPHSLQARASLLDEHERLLVGPERHPAALELRLHGGDAVVGTLSVRPLSRFGGALDERYVTQVRRQLAVIALLALVLGVGVALLVSRRLLRPISALREAAARVRKGDFATRVGLVGGDELSQLGRDFDELTQTLEDDARARRQWVADTSHELRTPLTVLRAELEALLDGVRPLTREAIESLASEVARMQKLAEDLGELARSDRGELVVSCQPLRPMELLDEVVTHFGPRFAKASLGLSLSEKAGPWRISADEVRLTQVFTNLLENSVRYTDAGGKLVIAASASGGRLVLTFDDTAPAVPAEALPKLFDRFYRAEPSRSRERGGAGLGLAICQRLVELQGGTIRAMASPLGGLRVELSFPLLEEAP